MFSVFNFGFLDYRFSFYFLIEIFLLSNDSPASRIRETGRRARLDQQFDHIDVTSARGHPQRRPSLTVGHVHGSTELQQHRHHVVDALVSVNANGRRPSQHVRPDVRRRTREQQQPRHFDVGRIRVAHGAQGGRHAARHGRQPIGLQVPGRSAVQRSQCHVLVQMSFQDVMAQFQGLFAVQRRLESRKP